MDPVKRRLVYVADESEVLLGELSGTPPTRQSRMTRLLVPLSPRSSSQESPHTASPLPRPIDRALLVSYNGFLLTDGSGRFATPRDAAQAADIRTALRTCCVFLKQYLDARHAESASAESYSTAPSSSTYREEEDSDLEDSSDSEDVRVTSAQRAARVAKRRVARTSLRSPSKMTVAELKAFLRAHGLAITGNKACLLQRAHEHRRGGDEQPAVGGEEACVEASREPSQNPSSGNTTKRNSGASVSALLSSPRSSQLQSPKSPGDDEDARGIWGALVHAGSRLFRSGARASWGFHPRQPPDSDAVPPAKRRRRSA
ncbi:SAP domain containing protein [Novymonas esmeraldas]|uniref:SAP domain containing protein n=1 Tax=Novymonas esmeraldas TaxID=1808958 RepID=A0AAW0EW06_9TRYP